MTTKAANSTEPLNLNKLPHLLNALNSLKEREADRRNVMTQVELSIPQLEARISELRSALKELDGIEVTRVRSHADRLRQKLESVEEELKWQRERLGVSRKIADATHIHVVEFEKRHGEEIAALRKLDKALDIR